MIEADVWESLWICLSTSAGARWVVSRASACACTLEVWPGAQGIRIRGSLDGSQCRRTWFAWTERSPAEYARQAAWESAIIVQVSSSSASTGRPAVHMGHSQECCLLECCARISSNCIDHCHFSVGVGWVTGSVSVKRTCVMAVLAGPWTRRLPWLISVCMSLGSGATCSGRMAGARATGSVLTAQRNSSLIRLSCVF